MLDAGTRNQLADTLEVLALDMRPRPVLLVVTIQSNGTGHNIVDADMGVVDQHPGLMRYYQGDDPVDFASNQWIPTDVRTTDRERWNVGYSMQRYLIEHGIPCALLIVTRGSTTVWRDWAAPPENGSKDLIHRLRDEGAAAVADPAFPLAANYRTVIVPFGGESDAADVPPPHDPDLRARNFGSRLAAHMDYVETFEWVQHPFWIVPRLNTASWRPHRMLVRQGVDSIAAERPNVRAYETSHLPLMPDLDHYSARELTTMGLDFAHIVERL